MRVLVVEDDAAVRSTVVDALSEDGFEVMEASSGAEALELIKDPDHIGLLVTDLHLPGPDGVAVAAGARAHTPDVPVLFISGRSDLLSSLAIPLPYSKLAKPFSLDSLAGMVRKLLNRP